MIRGALYYYVLNVPSVVGLSKLPLFSPSIHRNNTHRILSSTFLSSMHTLRLLQLHKAALKIDGRIMNKNVQYLMLVRMFFAVKPVNIRRCHSNKLSLLFIRYRSAEIFTKLHR